MKQIGYVTDVSVDGITISVTRSTACGDNCGSCSAQCELRNTSVKAEYRDDVKIGDKVVFEMATSRVMLAAVLVYLVPLIVLLAGYGISELCGIAEGYAVLIGLFGSVLWFVFMHFMDKRMKKFYKHIITEIAGDNTDVRL